LDKPCPLSEYENINEASRIRKEIVGAAPELNESNAELRATRDHELETRLILSAPRTIGIFQRTSLWRRISLKTKVSSSAMRWLSPGRWPRWLPARTAAFVVKLHRWVELYGGLGTTQGFGLHDTAHYVAPAISWQISDNTSLRFSPAIALTHGSSRRCCASATATKFADSAQN